jgi:hypothetical protein
MKSQMWGAYESKKRCGVGTYATAKQEKEVADNKPMRLVLIEWHDSFGCSSNWQELSDECRPAPMTCRSVGWLFRDDPGCKVIVPHIADVPGGLPKQGCGDMTIPSTCIQRIVDL